VGDRFYGDLEWDEAGWPVARLDDGLSLRVRSTGAKGWIYALTNGFFFGSPGDTQGPRVVIVNRFGREHAVMQYRSARQASRDITRMRDDIEGMGYFQWAETVGVPPHFDLMQPE
jgi:hypothetical protein